MRTRHWIIVVTALISCIGARADDTRRDGNWWRSETVSTRVIYMIGFFDGLDLGHSFSWWGTKTADGKVDTDALQKASDSYSGFVDKYLKHVTSGQIADGLTSFYEDYRNRSILLSDAVWIVLNTIAGKPQDELDKMIENFRKSASSSK